MAASSLDCEHGSGRYDADAEVFHFNAYDVEGHVLCAVTQEAFAVLSGIRRLDPDTADEIFVEWEDDVFAIARAKYDAGKHQDNGAVVVRASDIPG